MAAITDVTLATGRTLTLAGEYESLGAYLAPRQLAKDDGWREVTTADGRRMRLNIAATPIAAIEERMERRLGFA